MLLCSLHYSEAWVTYSHNLKSLEKFHDRSVRKIYGVKWQDRQTTNSVFEKASTTSIEAMVIKNQLRWSGHVVRMSDTRLPKQIMYSELETGKRTHGGQRKRYKDTLHRSLKQCFIRTQTWESLASDRNSWRSAVHKRVKIFEDKRRTKREEKRAARKASLSTNTPPKQNHPCPQIGRASCRERV